MSNGLFPWGEYRKWRKKPPLEEPEGKERQPRVSKALELARRYQETHPWLAKWLGEIPQPPPREPTPAPTFTPAFEELTRGVGAVGGLFELGKRAAPLIAAPFAPKVRERITKKDVLPTPEPPEGLPPSRMMEEYEKLPGVAKFFAEEAIFLPLYLAGGFGAKRAVEGLTRGLYKRFAEIAPRIEAGERLAGKDRLLYETIQRISKGRIETVTPQMEEEILRELYGTARITTAVLAPGDVARLAGGAGAPLIRRTIPIRKSAGVRVLETEDNLGMPTWVVLQNEKRIGEITGAPIGDAFDIYQLEMLAPGLARNILRDIEFSIAERAERMGLKFIQLQARRRNLGLYEKAGYSLKPGSETTVRKAVSEILPERLPLIGKQVLAHIPVTLQKELGALGWTIRDMSKMTAVDAKALSGVIKSSPDEVKGIKELLAGTPTEILTKPTARSSGDYIYRYNEVKKLWHGGGYIPEDGAIIVTDRLSNKVGLHELGHAAWAKFFGSKNQATFKGELAASKIPTKDLPAGELFADIFRKAAVGQAHPEFPKTVLAIRKFLQDVGRRGIPEMEAAGLERTLFRRGKRMAISLTPEQKAIYEAAHAEALTNKLAEFVRTLKPERVKAELTIATIRKQQAARLGTIQEQLAKGKISGEVAHKRMLGALKGEVPEARGPISDVVFTRAEVSSLKQIIGTTNKLPPVSENRYVRLHTMQALNTLLEGKIPTERGLALLERVFGEKFVKAFLRRRTIPEKIWVGAIEAAGLIKSVRASWDISAFYRQGAVLLTAHPQQIPAALKAQIKSVFSDAQALAIHDACHATQWEGVMETAKLYRPDFWSSLAAITAREEAYITRWARRIPGIKRSERAYIVGLNKIRTDFFGYQAEQWSRMGVKATPEDYRHLARAINILTGRGEVRNLEGALTALNAVLFSPRFQLSRILTPTLLFDSSPLVRKMAAKVLAKYYGFWSTMFGATAFLAHEDLSTDFNPLSTNFGKIRYKDTWIDPIAGYGPWFRLASRLMSSPIYAVAKTINEDDVAQFSIAAPRVKSTYSDTIREADLMRLLGTMLRTKLSPAATPIIDFMLGRTMVGKEVKRMGLEEQLMEYWSPLAIQAIIEATQEEGFVGGMVALPEFIGFGIYTIPVSEQLVSEINERYTDYRTMKTKHNELIDKGEIEKANTFAQAHPELLYGVMYGRVAKAIRNLQDQIVRVEDDEEMSSQDKEERIEALTIQIIELATGALGQEVAGEKGVPTTQPPRAPQRQPTTGTVNPFLR